MKSLLRLVAILTVALTTSVANAQTKVAIGYPPAADWLPAMVAKEKGYFDSRGLDVELNKIAIVSNIPAALMSGSLNIGATTPTALIDTSAAGLDLVAIVGATRFVKDPAIFSLVAREGSGIKSGKDLEGKRIGVPGIRSVADVLLRKWMMNEGVDVSKVSIVEAPFPQMRDLLKSGTIDAVPVLEPFRSRILADNTGYRVTDYIADVDPDILGVMWSGSRKWLDANPEVAPAFREAIAEAVQFIQNNPDQAREIEKKYLGYTTTIKVPYSLTIEQSELDEYAEMFKEVGFISSTVDTSKLIY
tara:strand:+ start:103395 stop:104303 length:909 start_codon:yes stop_codon:yes gene_type:complete